LGFAEPLGAAFNRLDRQVIFVNGLPDPRDGNSDRGLLVQNPAAIWVDATGRRFTNEAAPSKVTDRAVLSLSPATHWLIFDAAGEKRLTIRGAAWLASASARQSILDNPALVKRADNIASLAQAAGLPPDALADTVQRFNRFVEQSMDTDFGRIAPGMTEKTPLPIRQPPFYAVQLFPMTRKSLGGLAIDHEARVLGGAGQLIRGLFAAGETTGVAGINGSFGGSGTFLGPSVLTGRVAGRSAVALAIGAAALEAAEDGALSAPRNVAQNRIEQSADRPVVDLQALLLDQRPGYWHFNLSHTLVLERADSCDGCHKGAWSPGPAVNAEQRLIQLESCTRCH
jgi:hypothetical protein